MKGAAISVYTPQGVLALEPAAPGAFMLWAMVSCVTLLARVWRKSCVPMLKRVMMVQKVTMAQGMLS